MYSTVISPFVVKNSNLYSFTYFTLNENVSYVDFVIQPLIMYEFLNKTKYLSMHVFVTKIERNRNANGNGNET